MHAQASVAGSPQLAGGLCWDPVNRVWGPCP
jgi:hypothetical protein